MTNSTETVKKRRPVLRILLVVALVLLVFITAFGIYLNSYGRRDQSAQAGKVDVVIVLGAKVMLGRHTSMVERTRRGAELVKNGQAGYLLLTGGQGSDEDRSEASAMAELATGFGVPREKLILEDKSRNTRENALFSARICHERGWQKVIIVSDTFHLWRARRNFQHENLTVYTSPALQSDPSRHWYECTPMVLREEAAILRDMMMER